MRGDCCGRVVWWQIAHEECTGKFISFLITLGQAVVELKSSERNGEILEGVK